MTFSCFLAEMTFFKIYHFSMSFQPGFCTSDRRRILSAPTGMLLIDFIVPG